ncbi:Hint domain-containing protein [Rhodovulum adriaticum]|uniref:Hint domain-containing protein n=1 Tax=Rhodovulum adriaticum TaxID=35804 RepID=A0A4R2NXP1_RHOAD|nr:Hint domain-containing protein [Rhodovulum adriaticum]MBK1635677.1 2,3,4,5-tetrahydropyridine-2,6-carboxylate N-succinyltransferase [Rhodovulum adriaticum]TCP26185.1 Hint domain-containing protein [Rhodovulum adriaticum]
MAIAQELPIDRRASADEMAEEIFGDGVTVVDATYYGDRNASGLYSNADTVTPGVAPADSGVILSTGDVRDFTNDSGSTNTNTATGTSTDNRRGIDNDSLFNSLAGTNTYDAAYLEVDFIPEGDTLTLDFVIASEEYPEWVGSQYNDIIGAWINGVQATVTIGDGTASIGNINGDDTANLYIDNSSDQYNTEMDGFTVTLSFTAPVNVGEVNTLIIGVADLVDSQYDTSILIAGGSAQTAIIAQDDEVNLGMNGSRTLDVLDNDTGQGTLTVTHINGNAVSAGDSVSLTTGQTVVLNANGTFTIQGDGDEESVTFNYTIEDSSGQTDSGIVTVNQMPCFVAGTLIETPDGPRPIEDLRPGDLVLTRDEGPQPIRWIGGSAVQAQGRHAPVRIRKGHLGATRDLWVSQQHRLLIQDARAELLFGEAEVLAAAKHLADDRAVRIVERPGEVTYFHMLFARHQVVRAHGIWSESYHPGPMTMAEFDEDVQAEILELFPELDPETWQGYGPSARLSLRGFETRILAA